MELIAGPIKGYKAFNLDFTCLQFQFKVGETYELPDKKKPILCQQGFHFCQIPIHCNSYYKKNTNTRYAEIEAWDVIHGVDKSVARRIHIVREIPYTEWEKKQEGRYVGHYAIIYLRNGLYHREDGPAIEKADGTKEWCQNGLYHREDGPAIEKADGTKEWWRNGLLHREDGPAVERADGTEEWYQNGLRHRTGGPAIKMANGAEEWWERGERDIDECPYIF